MANQNTKRIGEKRAKEPVNKMDTLHDAWTVMRPFVKFSFTAMRVIAHSLIFIVKHIPKPEEHKPHSKNDRVIKI